MITTLILCYMISIVLSTLIYWRGWLRFGEKLYPNTNCKAYWKFQNQFWTKDIWFLLLLSLSPLALIDSSLIYISQR